MSRDSASGVTIPPPRVWEEPLRGAFTDVADVLRYSGLDQLRRFIDERQPPPPVHFLLGLRFESVAAGEATFSLPLTPWLCSPQRTIAGSTLALLADGPLGCAVQTVLPAATPYATAEMSLTFVRRVPGPPATLRSTCTVLHIGSSVGLAEGRIIDGTGAVVATCATRCVVLPRLPSSDGPARSNRDDASASEPAMPPPYQRPASGSILTAQQLDGLSGLEALRACSTGEVSPPPISHLCGIRPVEVEHGRTVWRMPASAWLCSGIAGRLYGGAIAYLAGTAIDGTAQSVAPSPLGFAPVDLKVYFLRPVRPDGRDLVATANVVHRGGRVVVCSSQVHDADGRHIAVAVGSALLRRRISRSESG